MRLKKAILRPFPSLPSHAGSSVCVKHAIPLIAPTKISGQVPEQGSQRGLELKQNMVTGREPDSILHAGPD